jgi:hypothetical protein
MGTGKIVVFRNLCASYGKSIDVNNHATDLQAVFQCDNVIRSEALRIVEHYRLADVIVMFNGVTHDVIAKERWNLI